jgi:Autotransporter beta-domain
MTIRLWPLALAAAINLCVCVGGAAAQTVFVRNAAAGDAVEVFINDVRAATGTIGSNGEAQIPVEIRPVVGKDDMDANVYVDTCPKVVRVFIISAGRQPASEDACRRSQIAGLYWVRMANTLVVNLASQPPSLMLVVGKYTPPAPGSEDLPHSWTPAPAGIVAFGGGLYGRLRDFSTVQCGDVATCEAHDGGFGYHAGGAFWIQPFAAGEAAYVRLPSLTANGSGTGFRFDSSLDASLVTVAGLVGAQGGPMRFYGKVGAAFHRATSTITQTNDPVTVMVDGAPMTIEGGTQIFETTTEGWGWLFGGGAEGWLNRYVALYGELDFARLQGNPTSGGEGELDDRVMLIFFGVRVHIGR